MTLKFNKIVAVVEVHVSAKFRQTKCSSLLIIVLATNTRNLSECSWHVRQRHTVEFMLNNSVVSL